MTLRVVAVGLEVKMRVAFARAEVYNAAKEELRVGLFGGGSVATFEFLAGDGPATAVTMNGVRLERGP